MNYLAHAALSFGNAEILVGNMISDFVKGKQRFTYPLMVQQGIMLHRAIDTYTDQHPVTARAKKIFQAHYRLYSAAFIDVTFDHFLAADHSRFPEDTLMNFSMETYDQLSLFANIFPEKFASMFPYMKKQNWLYNYQFRSGIMRSFQGLVYRAAYMHESETAFQLFEENYEVLRECYHLFYPDLENYARDLFNAIQPSPDQSEKIL